MPKRTDIKSILIIGAGPIVIGQACEFDYSGVQACKSLKEEGYRIILVNSNPATIMTDPNLADATYIEPITEEFIEKIIAREKPDAVLPTVGGQTALNCAVNLHNRGILQKYNVEMLGASVEAINKAEGRKVFNDAMHKIGLNVPKNMIVNSMEQAEEVLKYVGLSAILRPSFTLGGAGGGIVEKEEDFYAMLEKGLRMSPVSEVQVDESLIGYKEYEMEVVRDAKDNAIIVCSIENIDPMGVHTGDSITVAPAMTLTDKEYQEMRNASIAVLNEIGVNTGGSNVQFAVNPSNGHMVVIEMNPRVSRSSALASKATGFPIAKVAAKLAVGYTLDEIANDCTKSTPASFEPAIDYVVTKIPKFAFEKFSASSNQLNSSMKSVGEAMAVGRNFQESLQKALRSIESSFDGLDSITDIESIESKSSLIEKLKKPTPNRIFLIADALRMGLSIQEVQEHTHYDPWFIEQIKQIVNTEAFLQNNGLPEDRLSLLRIKQQGFSDQKIAQLIAEDVAEVTALREQLNVVPVYKRIDTCSAEFQSYNNYFYSSYEGDQYQNSECEASVSSRNKVIILGSGPNKIGQGIEFDYCCVQAVYAIKELGYEAIMINCNPETVSTDYDTADRLYFEPIYSENVLSVIQKEQSNGNLVGVMVQFGGQAPLKLARYLERAKINIIGTSPDSIDLAEDRERFKQLLIDHGLKQPSNVTCYSLEEINLAVNNLGYPIVARPSYVLGGQAMKILYNSDDLNRYLQEAKISFNDGPILLDSYLQDAIEVDVDAVYDGQDIFIAGIMEHIEEAGIHSGDSACSLPPYSLSEDVISKLKKQTRILAKALNVVGLMNLQFAIKDNEIFVLEVNPRASRTVPFIAKAIGVPVVKIASKVMLGQKLNDFDFQTADNRSYVAVKEVVLPFTNFPDNDIILGPEMKSTGEVMGIDSSFENAFAKAQLACNNVLITQGTVFISVKNSDKPRVVNLTKQLLELGFEIIATRGTADFLNQQGLQVGYINKALEGSPHVVEKMDSGGVQLIINTTEGAAAIADSFMIRATAIRKKLLYCTTISGSYSLVRAIKNRAEGQAVDVKSIQEYYKNG